MKKLRIPLSFAQQRLWFLDQLVTNKSLYNAPIVLSLEGDLNVKYLIKAINKLICRHESLRTIIESDNGEAYQVILPEVVINEQSCVIDVSNKDQSYIRKLVQEESCNPFDLSTGPLIRVKLLKVNDSNYILIINMHHIVSDGWSNKIISSEISKYYNAYLNHTTVGLQDLAIQYADYSIWQRDYLTGDVLEKQLAYWKEALSDIPDSINLPFDRSRPKEMSYDGGDYSFSLPKSIKEELSKIAEKEGCSLFMVLLSAFKIFLYRYSGQKNIVVGTPIANRHYKETEELIGFFVNTLAIRVQIEDNDNFIDVLRKVKEVTLSAYENQDIPFEQLVDHLQISRDLNKNPVFQIVFNYEENDKEDNFILDGVSIKKYDDTNSLAKFDLSFCAFVGKDYIELSFNYSKDIFNLKTIEVFSKHFEILLKQLLSHTKSFISNIHYLTELEQNKQLVVWNNQIEDFKEEQTVVELFEDQVLLHTNKTALVYEDKELSYGELNQFSNILANILRDYGMVGDSRVSVCLERSFEMIIGLLGILKSGGCYIPIDPTHPKDRIEYILKDTNSEVIVTQAEHLDKFRNYNGTLLIIKFDISRDLKIKEVFIKDDIANTKTIIHKEYYASNLTKITLSNHLAYIIYTSGSTGYPKGVMISHHNLYNYLFFSKNYTVNGDAILFHSSYIFDMSILSIFLALIIGKIIFINDSDTINMNSLSNRSKYKIGLIKLTPTHIKLLKTRIQEFNNFKTLEANLIVGGEVLKKEDLSCINFLKYNLYNEYGPTETTVGCIVNKISTLNKLKSIPIGRPINNTNVYILDRLGMLLPVGVIGEIYIGGVGLARGYLNRPDLTAGKFVPNPFAGKNPNTNELRLYRTGDLARYLPDGNIEFIGRIDDQVKIRGFRIELGEIESVLTDHSDVNSAIVSVIKEKSTIVAYIVPGDFKPCQSELLEYLKNILPEYMIPSYYVYIDSIPLTKNGKVDKKRLPLPDLSNRMIGDEYVAPRNDTEKQLAAIWSEVLKLKKIGIHDNFFKIGGHSLLATQIISRIREEFACDIQLRSIFEYPTIAELINHIKSSSAVTRSIITKHDRAGKIPLSFAQQRLWFLDQLVTNKSLYNAPIVLSLEGDLNVKYLIKAINKLICRHESLRTIIESDNGEAYQVILPEVVINEQSCVIDVSNKDQSYIRKLIQEESCNPFDLSTGPLIRVKLLKVNDSNYILIINMHHIVSDGWSNKIISSEISKYYNAYLNHTTVGLQDLAIQYADYSIWQRDYLTGDVLEKQLAYWKEALSDIPDSINLPFDRSRPKEMSYDGGDYSFSLPKSIKEELSKIAEKEGCSLFMVLLSAFKIFLYRYSGQKDIVVGTPIANRHYKETEELIGFFVNTLAIRVQIEDNDNFIDVLRKVKEVTLSAYENQDIPFEQLVDHLQISRDLNKNPVFQIMFSYDVDEDNNAFIKGFNLGNNVLVNKYDNPLSVAKFDLSVRIGIKRGQLFADVNYNKELFNLPSIKNIIKHFAFLLKELLSKQNLCVFKICLLNLNEKTQQIILWNDTDKQSVIKRNIGKISIGHSVYHSNIYILDRLGILLPVGVIGEIYIGGVGLARGYLNRPDLTAEKFVPNPFAGKNPNTNELRLYRTGDLARYLPDGNIEFIGRIDDQVKIRGFRIELGEIESVLTNHKDIEHTIVNVQEGENGKYLIAYIIPKDLNSYNIEHSIVADSGNTYNVLSSERLRSDVDTLKAYLSSKLPEYMIPSYYVYIDSIPLTKNGKVDKKSLPLPDLSNRMIGDEYVAPRNDTEKQLAAIWSEVLKLKKIGIHDNFFKIGGHSLLATQIISRIREEFACDIQLRSIFEYPTIAELINHIKSSSAVTRSIITKHDRAGKIPLSFAQQRLWFLDQLVTNKSLYNAPIVLSLEGDLNVKYLIKAINKLICRHESLRTIIESDNGEAYQVILPEVVINEQSCVIDVSNKDQSYIRKLVQEESCNPFDLITGPLIRVKLLKVNDSNYILIINMHHIVSDGWSNKIISSEISKYYNAYLNHTTVGLQELAIQYADYSIWQRDYLTGDVLEKQLAYWKEALSDIPDSINLPFDRLRPKEMSYDGGDYSFSLPKSIKEELSKIAEKEGCSLFMVLLSAFKIFLYRYSGQKNIVVGTPIANRHYKETEELIGFFVNTLAIRVQIEDNDNFIDVLRKVKEVTLSAYENQDIPFEQLVDHLQISRDLNKNPVFQIVFNYEENDKEDNFILDGVSIKKYDDTNSLAKFDLSFCAFVGKDYIELSFNYSKDIFNLKTIEVFSKHFEILLKQLLSHTKSFISNIHYLTELEQNKQLVVWNNQIEDFKEEQTVVELFEDQVLLHTNKTALVYEDKELSYGELNQFSNILANILRDYGMVGDSRVSVCLERSFEMIIGLLGILKSGGCYIPIDPTHPKDRIEYILKDTNSEVIVTQAEHLDKFRNYNGTLLIIKFDISRDLKIKEVFIKDDIANTKTIIHKEYYASNLTKITLSNHLAYIIYTSGSTGYPKGVMISHHNLYNLLIYAKNKFRFTIHDVWSFIHSFIFDFSVWEIFCCLISAGKLIILSKSIVSSSHDFFKLLKKEKITVLNQTPTVLKTIEYFIKRDLNELSIKYIILGGERVNINNLKEFNNIVCDAITTINMYGITEITITATHQLVKRNIKSDIGKKLEHLTAYILDRLGMLLPVGVIGEIYIGGVGLARGYLNRPDLTAEKFVPNPFAGKNPNTNELRLYRTGDLARYLPDGNIEFIGRIDDQVKIRGFRIELGEIESVLTNHKDIEHTIVNVQEGENGKYLIAYIIPKDLNSYNIEHSIVADSGNTYNVLSSERLRSDVDTLKAYLSSKLPEYMIPSYYVYIDSIPLTKNGKVDKKSLPLPDLSNRMIGDEYVAPRNDTEKQLAAIWSEVLKLKKIGIHDNFFKIGGHSLLATQIISRIREEFACDIQLRSIFEYPTIAELINHIKSSSAVTRSIITKHDRAGKIPLSFAQQRLWFLDQLVTNKSLYNAPIVLSLEGDLNVKYLIKAINKLICRHESLRTIIESDNGEAYQVILPEVVINEQSCVIDVSNKDQSYIRKLVQEESCNPFDLITGPLIRVKLLKVNDSNYILIINMHHIVSDGWSNKIISSEISKYYNAYLNHTTVGLQELAIQYADYSIWQRDYLTGDVLEKQLAYWKEALSDIPDSINLPFDRLRPKEMSYDGGDYSFSLPKSIKEELSKIAEKEGCSLFMVLLSAFKIFLYRYSGQKNIVVGTPIANRHYKETEELIGFFVNTLAIRVQIEDNDNFIDVLRKVKEVTLSAYENQDIPFEQLVDHLQISRDLNKNPVFQIVFNYEENDKEDNFILDGVSIKKYDDTNSLAKFDLSFCAFVGKDYIELSFNYSKDIFNLKTIEVFSKHFEILLKQLLSHTKSFISNIHYLTELEQNKQLVVWNNQIEDFKEEQTVVELFEDQVLLHTNKTALVYEDKELSYGELNQFSNILANILRDYGMVGDSRVSVCLERSFEMIIGLLGILKSGGCYIPIDPTHPKDRIEYILKDTNSGVIVTQAEHLDKFRNYNGTLLIIKFDISRDLKIKEVFIKDDIANTKTIIHKEYYASNLTKITLSNHLAYIIYTSGSTGYPKGVMISHHNLYNLLIYAKNKFRFTIHDVWSFIHSFIFDFSVWEIFCCLISAGKLIILSKSIVSSSHDFFKLLKKEKITVLNQTPTVLKTIEYFIKRDLNELSIKYIILGGERVNINNLKEFNNIVCDAITTINMYGITEITIHATHQLVKRNIKSDIGKKLEHLTAYILDRLGMLLPVGVIGEIYIGGVGLARGYLNRPDLTAEKFVPNPFAGKNPNTNELRLYRTGDLARYLPDGNIEFIGRIDDQVKIRGFRIELGEIESVLTNHKDIEHTIVNVQEGENGKYLIAYIIPKDLNSYNIEHSIVADSGNTYNVLSSERLRSDVDTLKAYLSSKLPEYMIPSYYVYIDSVPLTKNGKVDKKSLPLPGLSNRMIGDEYVAPRNDTEKQLAAIWSEVLKIKKIGIHDNFFKIGGHSLLIAKLIHLVYKNMQKKISFRDVFINTTIREQAKCLNYNRSNDAFFTRIKDYQGRKILFLIHPGSGLSSPYRSLAKYISNVGIYGINNPCIGQKMIYSTIQELSEKYANTIKDLSISKKSQIILGGWSIGGLIAYEVACYLTSNNIDVKKLLLIDPTKPLSSKKRGISKSEMPYINYVNEKILNEELNRNVRDFNILLEKYKPLNKQLNNIKTYLFTVLRDWDVQSEYISLWNNLIKNINIINIKGVHQSIFEEPNVKELANQLRNIL